MEERKHVAISKAEKYITTQGYKHGPCIGATCRTSDTQAIWDVEFAHEGLSSRSETTDPPSITLIVNLDQDSICLVDVM